MAASRRVVAGGQEFDGGQFEDIGSEAGQNGGEHARLFTRPCDNNALTEERELFEPTQLFAEAHDFADDHGGWRLHALFMNENGQCGQGADDDLLIGARGPADGHSRGFGIASGADGGFGDAVEVGEAMKRTSVSAWATRDQSMFSTSWPVTKVTTEVWSR